MTRFLTAGLLVIMFIAVSAFAEAVKVLPPNDSSYSAAELAGLLPAIDGLSKILSDYSLGSGKYFTSDEWNSLDFSAYTAGMLSRLGYVTKIVVGERWPDGKHCWVLVGIVLPTQTAWVPVEASPGAGKSQTSLGAIPSYTDALGKLWFDARYGQFSEEISLPDNVPPVPQIRAVPINPVIGREVSFLGTTSYDPDGEIISYHWEFSDGTTIDGRVVRHSFSTAGTYNATLTVVDGRGGVATVQREIQVREPGKSPPPPDGCGCGG